MLLKRIQQLIKIFNKYELRYSVIGGIAVLLHGGRASTIDFDLYLIADDLEKLKEIAHSTGFEILFWGDDQIRLTYETLPIDILIADSLLGTTVYKRSLVKQLGDVQINVASPEDIIVMKTIADRPIDRRDIEELNEIFSASLDRKYIGRQIKRLKSKIAK